MGSVIVTICLVVALVAILGWIDDWSGSRRRAENSRYWRSQDIHCPDCNRSFTTTEVDSGGWVITPNAHFDVSLTVPSCGESCVYARADGLPTLRC